MPFQRQYTRSEVQGMIHIYEGSRPIQGINPVTHQIQRQQNPSHPSIHAGASFLDQRGRVNTPGQPRTTGTYWTEADQIDATMHVINHHLSQIVLRQLDMGQPRIGLETPLPANRFRISIAQDASDLGPGTAGHLGRNNAARAGAGSHHQQGFASRGFVLLIKGVGNRLQVQTSYPIL